MPIYASAGSGTKFQPAPAGTYAAVCCDVFDLGVLTVEWQGQKKQQHKVLVSWQINEDRDDGKPYLVSKRYTLSLHEKAGLRKDLEAWRGRKFTEEELHRFDVETIVGKPCLLNIIHNQSGGDTYANVAGVMALPKGMPAPIVRDFVRRIDREPQQHGVNPLTDAEHFDAVTADDIPF
jgi:hypothetical protein